MKAILDSITSLKEIYLVFIFFLIISSLSCLLLFGEILKKKCMNLNYGIISQNYCGNIKCSINSICIYSLENPEENLTNFDNIFSSNLQIMRIITLDNWTFPMNIVQRIFSNFSWIIFILIIFIGNFFVINLLIAALKVTFCDKIEKDEILFEGENLFSFNFSQIKKLGYYSHVKMHQEILNKNTSIFNFLRFYQNNFTKKKNHTARLYNFIEENQKITITEKRKSFSKAKYTTVNYNSFYKENIDREFFNSKTLNISKNERKNTIFFSVDNHSQINSSKDFSMKNLNKEFSNFFKKKAKFDNKLKKKLHSEKQTLFLKIFIFLNEIYFFFKEKYLINFFYPKILPFRLKIIVKHSMDYKSNSRNDIFKTK